MAKGSESKVGDGTRPKSYGHDPILSAQQGDQFTALTGNYSDPAYLTALRNRFNGDAGGYSGRNDLLQQANMAQLVGNQNAYQDQAQKASAIRDSQEARQTQQRNTGIWERAVANKIGGASADELNRSKQFQQALALRLKQDPTAGGAMPPPPPPAAPPEPVAPTAPTQDQILQEALARQRASSGSHRNDSSPWYFMPGAKGGPPLAPSAPAVPPESAAPAAPTQDQIRQEALARQKASSGSHRNDSSPWYFMPGAKGGPPL